MGPLLLRVVGTEEFGYGKVKPTLTYVNAHLVAVSVLLTAYAVPRDLSEESYEELEKSASPELRRVSKAGIAEATSIATVGGLAEHPRKWIWFLGVVSCTTCCCLVTCSQVGTSLILELYYGWAPASIALGLAVATVCSLPFLLIFIRLSEIRDILICGFGTLASGVILLVLTFVYAERLEYSIFVTDGLLYVFCTAGMALNNAAATNASIADTSFSKRNFVALSYLDGSV